MSNGNGEKEVFSVIIGYGLWIEWIEWVECFTLLNIFNPFKKLLAPSVIPCYHAAVFKS
jgi:hypothetical protein